LRLLYSRLPETTASTVHDQRFKTSCPGTLEQLVRHRAIRPEVELKPQPPACLFATFSIGVIDPVANVKEYLPLSPHAPAQFHLRATLNPQRR